MILRVSSRDTTNPCQQSQIPTTSGSNYNPGPVLIRSSPSNGANHDSIEPVSENIVTGNTWQDDVANNNRPEIRSPQVQHRLSFDQPSGVIMLPDEEWLNEKSDSDEVYQGPGHSSEVTQHPQESDAHGEENVSKPYAT
ncbi:hypothetical protein NM688_g4445 [Phlebia brevispora]|uniref:Uncharacterized protein n=1 Tax=Phlebia brevispora TaxID=194682 RepID=A0ACC1T318_9APHY|nr:hypothetical protein NM688_g4445 [Phlebia brevispora]